MRFLTCVIAVPILVALESAALAQAPRFFADDPLLQEPAPLPVSGIEARALSAVLETVSSSFTTRGERHPDTGIIPARGVNTLGEVMDGDWYVNRHGTRRMTIEELQRGPRNDLPPAADAPWQVLVVKPFGINPGLLVADARRNLYVLRFDPPGYEGLATGAEMVSSRFLYALGYHVTENYIVRFPRSRLVASEEGQTVSSSGRPRRLVPSDISAFLRSVPDREQIYRAVATRVPERREALLGPYQVWGTRSDDPNDIVPHEHRRDLRGLFVFSAWLNNGRARAVDTLDVLTPVDGVNRVRHYLVDLTRSLGSGARNGPKLAWEGHETIFAGFAEVGRNALGMGVVTPAWMRQKYPDLPEVGAFSSANFDPDTWKTHQPVAPFENRLPDDTFWAAKQVMAFTDAEIRAVVRTGEYSRPAEDSITATLIERRNLIGRTYLARVLPLDRFRVTNNTLAFDDLGVVHGLSPTRSYAIEWFGFDNEKGQLLSPAGSGAELPPAARVLQAGSYVAARVHAGDPAMHVMVYVRRGVEGFDVVGLDRAWPGKVIAPPLPAPQIPRQLYQDLAISQRALFQVYIDDYNAARGSQFGPEEGFNNLTVSERTTFYAVTHALMRSQLTDETGANLGTALDRVAAVERIAGQNPGLSADQQFRLYVTLKPDTREVLERSREFNRDHQNTIYHAGYPDSYRQAGRTPNIQLSLTEDGLHADIDVDYRSSRAPQGLFNGHMTAANSDVRVGRNSRRHNGRWQGLIPWWQQVFGTLGEPRSEEADLLMANRPDSSPTPLPPDRPAGAAPDRIEDAAQEFLTDWLVRRQYGQALEFLSSKAYGCVNLDDEQRTRNLDGAAARRELLRLMEYAAGKLGPTPNLTDAIVAFTPRDPQRTVVDHPFRQEFLLGPLPEAAARTYLCSQSATPPSGAEYYAVVFRYRRPGGATLGLLWSREGGQWKLVAYQPLVP